MWSPTSAMYFLVLMMTRSFGRSSRFWMVRSLRSVRRTCPISSLASSSSRAAASSMGLPSGPTGSACFLGSTRAEVRTGLGGSSESGAERLRELVLRSALGALGGGTQISHPGWSTSHLLMPFFCGAAMPASLRPSSGNQTMMRSSSVLSLEPSDTSRIFLSCCVMRVSSCVALARCWLTIAPRSSSTIFSRRPSRGSRRIFSHDAKPW
mmetsp:Transcript_646/g.2362  ORF Transcript_646/g.2362 Transcript_646/m.2362 type:complete len:209 (+) Transcript_646:188-814(+)